MSTVSKKSKAVEVKTIAELKKEQQDKLSKLFESLGIFFAFDKEQFESQKQEGITYVSSGSGMLIPKDKVEDFKKGFALIERETKAQYNKHINMGEYILYELNNHETFYTGNLEDSLDVIRYTYPGCTYEDVKRVFNQNMED